MTTALAVGVGGALGAVARHAVYEHVERDAGIPRGTLLVNVLGSFLLGATAALASAGVLDANAVAFAGTGACGAFTTFSTHAFETMDRLEHSSPIVGVLNVGVTLALALAAAALGYVLVTLA